MRSRHPSLAVVAAIACGTSVGSEAADTGGSTTSTTTTSSTSVSTSTSADSGSSESTTVVETSESSTTGTDDSSTTGTDGSSTSSASESGSSDSGSESGVVMHQACIDGCAIEFMCGDEWASAEECSDWCEANLVKAAAFSPFCADAWENLSACFGTLDCDQFAEYEAPMMFPFPCSDAADALAFECKGQ